jgi:hypothetical protein
LGITACTPGTGEKSAGSVPPTVEKRDMEKFKKTPFHGDIKTDPSATTPVVNALKKNYLPVSTTKNIGTAFDSYTYAKTKQWKDAPTKNGPYYIDYICTFEISPLSPAAIKDGVIKRELDIKFAIQEDGETYIAMASRIDIKSDGMRYIATLSPDEIKRTVTAIYENREITF